MRILCGLLLALSLLSCGGPSAQQGGGDKVDFKYASLISIVSDDWQSLGGWQGTPHVCPGAPQPGVARPSAEGYGDSYAFEEGCGLYHRPLFFADGSGL